MLQLNLLISHLAWPIAMIVALVAFKRPLSLFLEGIAQHATKLSAWQFTIELADVPALKPLAIPTLEDIQQTTPTSWTSDSSGQLFEQIKNATIADYAIVDLGEGKDWLTSRLFIFAVMLERMRDLKCLVFLAGGGTTSRQFIGWASPSKVRWALAQEFPWLEAAYIKAYAQQFSVEPKVMDSRIKPIISLSGALESFTATSLVSFFVQSLQEFTPPPLPFIPPLPSIPPLPLPPVPEGWVQFDTMQERALWLDEKGLRALLTTNLNEDSVPYLPDESPAEQAKKVLRRKGEFVVVVDQNRFKGLVNRKTLLENLGVRLSQSDSLV